MGKDMANRALQAKALKLRRMKRLFPRYLSADYIPTGKPPDRFVIQEYKERTRSLAFDEAYLAHLEAKALFHGVPPGRLEAEAHIKRIKELTPAMHCVTICDMPALKAQLFYNAEKTRFMVLETNYLICTMRTSMQYQDRTRCIDAWRADTVRWVEFSSLRSPPDSD
jgi:hypothetical protein